MKFNINFYVKYRIKFKKNEKIRTNLKVFNFKSLLYINWKFKEGYKMLITFFRSILIYIFVLIVMRLMGKREIGQLQPFELAISIMIADLASIPMTDTGVPITNGIVPILGLLVMHLIISLLNMKSIKARQVICRKTKDFNL